MVRQALHRASKGVGELLFNKVGIFPTGIEQTKSESQLA
jgi:hypothetical protein